MHSFLEFVLLLEDRTRINKLKELNPHIDTSHDQFMTSDNMNKFKEPEEYEKWKDFRFDPQKLEYYREKKHAEFTIDKLAEHDPTQNKQYTQYLIGQYKKKHLRYEDLPRIKEHLEAFHQHKPHLNQNAPEAAGIKDVKNLDSYKHWRQLHPVLQPYMEGAKASNVTDWEKIKKEGRDLIHDENGLKVYKLKTKEASCALYGSSTDWCTAYRDKHNAFEEHHKRGPLYVIHTPNHRLFQLHFPSEQLMDEKDYSVDPKDLTEAHPELKNVKEFKKIDPVKHDMVFHFMHEHEKKGILKKWATKGNIKQKMKAAVHGDDEIHNILKDDSNSQVRDKVINSTYSPHILTNFVKGHTYNTNQRLYAQFRLETDFNIHQDSLSHWSAIIKKGSEEHLRALARGYLEHHNFANPKTNNDYIKNSAYSTILTTKDWHLKKKEDFEKEYHSHFPEISSKHKLENTSETNLLHALKKARVEKK